MRSKLIGGIMLIIGTSVGGGMLALPVATAAGGFFHSALLLFSAWLVMTLGSLLMLEVSLWLPEGTNLISMARATLGRWGQVITWFVYLLLLYSLLSAYIAGGSDLLHNLLQLIHIESPAWLNSILFVVVFGFVISRGILIVDWANRSLISTKFLAYVLIVALILPQATFKNLEGGQFKLLGGAVMMTVTSFGYASIIPTLRSYFKGHIHYLRLAVWIGSLISLGIYLLWNLTVQGTIESEGSKGLVQMASSGHAASDLMTALATRLQNPLIALLVRVFASICVATSFLGITIGLVDFLADGLNIKQRSWGKLSLMLLSLGPPLLVILFYPGAFIKGLSYAGLFCVVLLMLLPSLMAWSGRYIKKISHGYKLQGDKVLIAFELVMALSLLVFGIFHLA
ncbi:MAG TPA: aromatic amino acid transport family protein [Coxiellaceae bacterium]|nr:aromatic amino acid transport family protein [Coxiellaceae bacterium]